MTPEERKIAGKVGLLVVAASIAAYFAPETKVGTPPDVGGQLKHMAILAVFIERSVEVYLGVFKANGPERVPLAGDEPGQPATIKATLAALVLGLLISLVGVRILPSVGFAGVELSWPMEWIRSGVDVVISGALMAGGSLLVHEVAEATKAGLRNISGLVPASENNVVPFAHRAQGQRHYPSAEFLDAGLVETACAAAYDANKDDCNKFAKAVCSHFGISVTGQADEIVDQISGAGWTLLTGGGPQAKASAEAGMLVVAGLKGAKHNPPRSNGHVAIIVPGPLAPRQVSDRLLGVDRRNTWQETNPKLLMESGGSR